jgi:6-phosphogluconolactonase
MVGGRSPENRREEGFSLTAPEVRIFADAGALADALARRLLDDVSRALEAKPRPAFCLTGGSTAGALYERLAAAPGGPAWKRVHFFWGDERFVPRGDPDSNHRLAWDAWLKPLGVPAENLHPVATEASDPRASAAASLS